MSDNLSFEGVSSPEIVIGLVGALGAPLKRVESLFDELLKPFDYTTRRVHLSDFLDAYAWPTPHPDASVAVAERYALLMDRGNALRGILGRGDALAMHAAAHVSSERPKNRPRSIPNVAYVLRQLKHPDEVRLLRQVYGDAFHLVGVYSSHDSRSQHLRNVDEMDPKDAEELIKRDAGEEFAYGQQVTKTFHLSDFFIEIEGLQEEDVCSARAQIERYLMLIFGKGVVTPSKGEYWMYLAYSAALRSSDLSRQVGAVLISGRGELLSVGANEVPAAGGGLYWESEGSARDVDMGFDANRRQIHECVEEVLCALLPGYEDLAGSERAARFTTEYGKLRQTRLMNLTEFGRAVHAEMEALLSAARQGVSVTESHLYTTTYPCHNCAKHIVGSGVRRVVFIEPYPKSLAVGLHGDAISLGRAHSDEDRKVDLVAFVGVAPRRFARLFSSVEIDGSPVRRKMDDGNLIDSGIHLRLCSADLTHVDREAMVAQFLAELTGSPSGATDGGG